MPGHYGFTERLQPPHQIARAGDSKDPPRLFVRPERLNDPYHAQSFAGPSVYAGVAALGVHRTGGQPKGLKAIASRRPCASSMTTGLRMCRWRRQRAE